MTHTYHIKGMSCNGCQSYVEKALRRVKGIKAASVNLKKEEVTIEIDQHIPLQQLQKALEGSSYEILRTGVSATNSPDSATSFNKDIPVSSHNRPKVGGSGSYYCPMHCEGDKTYDQPGSCPVCGMDLIEQPALKKSVSYTCPMHPEIIRDTPGSCPICGMNLVPMEADPSEEDRTYKRLLFKFKIALIFTLPIFIISMSDMAPNNPLYKLMDLKYWNWASFILSLPVVFYATGMFFERAWKSIITRHLNMFTLIGIGSGVAWLFSVAAIFLPNIFPGEFKSTGGTVYVYFEAATVILTLVLLGQVMEARAHGKTHSAIKELLKLAPHTATRITADREEVVSIDDIHQGDLLRVKPGEKVPVDGHITEGEVHIDESMITGEPVPVDKRPGDPVRSGTINGNRTFVMMAEKVGSETLLSQIIEMIHTASRSKAPVQKLADKISAYFVPIVVLIAVMTFIIWSVFGPAPSHVYALVNAVAVLIIACPCALGLATPMSVMVGVGKGAQSGILIKNAEALEKMSQVEVVVVDKTGTVTEGRPSVEKVVCTDDHFSDQEILQKIVSLNSSSEHPLAQATLRYGEEKNIFPKKIYDFEAVSGKGVKGKVEDNELALGNIRLMEQLQINIPKEILQKAEAEQQKGKTVSYLSEKGRIIGFVVITDKIKPMAKEAVQKLHKEELEVWLFTGDNENTAKAVSKVLGLDGFKADMLPEDKLEEIQKIQAKGKKVAMAGDGINDAPALAQADIGIAMGTGTDVAIESAQITLVKGDLKGIAKARQLSRKTTKNIRQNLWFALGYNVIGIPIAAGALFPLFGLLLSPMIAALAMSFSSVSVITNSLRLRKAALY